MAAYITRAGMATLSSLRSINSMEQIRKDLVSFSFPDTLASLSEGAFVDAHGRRRLIDASVGELNEIIPIRRREKGEF